MLATTGWIILTFMGTFVLAAAPSEPAGADEDILSTDAVISTHAFYVYLFTICASLVVLLVGWRVVIDSIRYVRTLTCLNNPTQRYFSKPSPWFATFKGNILYAPIFRKRHNREFQLSTAVNIGTLPTRLQLLFLLSYLGINVAFCVVSIDWYQPLAVVAQQLRNRSGIFAVVNMVPLFILAARNNPLILCLNISYDTFNLLHRWFGRIVILEATVHSVAWFVTVVEESGWPAVMDSIQGDPMVLFGLIAMVSFFIIGIQAISILRHAFYETFKYVHIALIISSVIGIWYHLRLFGLPQVDILMGIMAIWGSERLLRVFRVIYRNIGNGGSKALVEALPGNAVRVTLDLARPWAFKPGQHAYLYIPSVGLWTSHPFSIAWSEEAENLDGKKGLASNHQEVLALRKTRMSFIIRARTGFTHNLYIKASAAPEGKMYTRCFAEGPYGGLHTMHSYGTVMLFAGGIGISHQVPYVRELVAEYSNGTVATRKIILVWVIQSPEHLEWIRPWMTEILTMEKRREILRIMLFVSRPRSTKEIHSPSATVQMFPGRPNVDTLLDMEIDNQIGAMGVSVCAGGSLSDDVRKAVRSRQHASSIDFFEESFSW